MANEENWRTPTDAQGYFGGQSKKLGVADRRPVIRNAADLVGPGINAQATPITNFNDPLATYNGYYSAVANTSSAPKTGEAFVGTVVADSEIGGVQRFTGMTSKVDYKRVFQRNPSNPESIFWGAWQQASDEVPVGLIAPFAGNVAPSGWLLCNGVSYATALYPALFAVTGYAYGGGGTAFNVPDLRDRTVYGAGSAWSVGSTDGLATGSRTKNMFHTHASLITNQTGAHTHSISEGGTHNHGGGSTTGPPSGTVLRQGGATANADTAGPSHNHSFNIPSSDTHGHGGATGSGGDHYHSGATWDNPGDGPLLRGTGAHWIIRHGAAL